MNHIYSIIVNGQVTNVIVCDNYELANEIARESFGNSAIAVESSDYAVKVGDKYTNGKFYRDSSELVMIPTAETKLNQMNEEIEMLIGCLLELSEVLYE